MKIHDLKRTSGKAVLSVWPPHVLADGGTTFVRPGDGVLKGVRRIAKRLSLVIDHGGREVVGRLECDEPSTLDAVALQIALGNQGRAPIRKEHILGPLEIRIQPPVSVLDAKVTRQSRDVVRLQVEDAAELYRHGRLPLTFSILEQDDSGTIQIIYTGVRDIAPQVTGTIEGQSSLRNLGAKPINRLASVCDA